MQRSNHVHEARVWRGSMPVQYLYTAGVAGERFFQTLRTKSRFAVTACAECRITYLPPRLYCEQCFGDLSQTWADVPPYGRVHSYTIVHQDHDGQRLKDPVVVAFVRIDGTDGGLLGRLLKVRIQDIRLEMPVEAVFVPVRRRQGRMDDLLGFAPHRILSSVPPRE